ncbi:branched-chain amino acid ABC transporter permease [Euzebya tangerina]|uniref:branched-chain amino acid ABC transporter permease n=1 Tax=Euzebya tangerina TaxID=591198 RepID=UPI000E324E2F|nr:branched-chain amino acid ABC transporter permease [Euzebya tangerina]
MSGKYTTDYRQDMRLLRTTSQRAIAGVLAVLALLLPFALEADISPPLDFPWAAWFAAINLALIASVGAAAFNLLLGYTHQISVAHAAFLMLGTVVGATMGTLWGVNFIVVLLASLVAGALIGAIVGLPALRFRGLYLLIATFGVHFFFFLGYKKFQTTYFGFNAITFDPPQLPAWLHALPFITPDDDGIFAISGNFRWYWVLLPIAILSILFMNNVIRTREGRSFMAIKEHDVSASLIGINVTRAKLLAFSLSSAFVSLTGVLGAYYIGARGEDSFPFQVVLFYAIMIIVGGFSTMQGAVFGAFFFYMTPVFFDWVRSDVPGISSITLLQRYANETNLAIFGILIIVVLVARPTGLSGIWQRIRQYFATWPYST